MSKEDQIFNIKIRTTDGELLLLKHFKDGRSICPVCGSVTYYPSSPAWAPTSKGSEGEAVLGFPSWDICPDCGTQFGLDDMDLILKGKVASIGEAWALIRKEWLLSMRRLKKLEKAIGQLKNIDISDAEINEILKEKE